MQRNMYEEVRRIRSHAYEFLNIGDGDLVRDRDRGDSYCVVVVLSITFFVLASVALLALNHL